MLPTSSADRKDVPLATGVLDYFPAALAQVAKLSKQGNEKHNPGEELHHARGKSMDHADCILRHLAERGSVDTDGFLHEVKVAWRALALLQEAMEERGAPLARAARPAEELPQLELPNLAWFEDAGTDVRNIPTITNITDGEVYNNIDERIAGDTLQAKKIKNEYYRDLIIGKTYDVKGSYSCALLLGFRDNGNAVVIPWGLSATQAVDPDSVIPVAYSDHWAKNMELRAEWLAVNVSVV